MNKILTIYTNKNDKKSVIKVEVIDAGVYVDLPFCGTVAKVRGYVCKVVYSDSEKVRVGEFVNVYEDYFGFHVEGEEDI